MPTVTIHLDEEDHRILTVFAEQFGFDSLKSYVLSMAQSAIKALAFGVANPDEVKALIDRLEGTETGEFLDRQMGKPRDGENNES